MATFEARKDFSAEVKIAVEESASVLQSSGIEDAIAVMLPLEKKCRVNNDNSSLKEVSVHIVRLCRAANDWDKLSAMLGLINKRSSQIKSVLTAVVTEATEYLSTLPSVVIKVAVLKSLKEVCDGKIYLEGESAKFHFMLSKIYEERGDITAACEIIQDVHVETYGSLSKKEKAEYILEQIRLNLLKKDYIRVSIHSRKMNPKTIEEDGFEEIKLRFYRMQIEFYTHEKNAWEICQSYFKIANTKLSDLFNADNCVAALEACIVHLLASKRDNHQSDMLHRMKTLLPTTFKTMTLNKAVSNALALFSKDEVIVTPFEGQTTVEEHSSWRIFDTADELQYFLEQFRARIIEHNLRVIAKYYQRINMARLQQLMNLPLDKLEEFLADMSFTGDLTLKIDRPAGIVTFSPKRTSEEVLSEWSGNIDKMLQLMEATCHLINRENMVYKA